MHCTSSPIDLFNISFLILHRASQRNISILLLTTNGNNIPSFEERSLKPLKVLNFHFTWQEGLQSAKQWTGPIIVPSFTVTLFWSFRVGCGLTVKVSILSIKWNYKKNYFLIRILSFTIYINIKIKDLHLLGFHTNKYTLLIDESTRCLTHCLVSNLCNTCSGEASKNSTIIVFNSIQ